MKPLAVIFDMDGTIVDSEEAWGISFVKVLSILNIKSTSKHPQIGGVSLHDNWKMILERDNIKTEKSVNDLVELTLDCFRKQIHTIVLKEGAQDFFHSLKNKGIRIVLATSTHREEVNKIFTNLKIEDEFEFMVTGDDVKNKKPAPDVFLKTLEKLNLSADECLVIEDSPTGIIAAKAAGIKVVAMVWQKEYPKLLDTADFVARSFKEVDEEIINQL